MPRYLTLIIHDERGDRYYVRPAEAPEKRVERTKLVLTSRIARRCDGCGEYECICEEERQ